ncbi:hypothetical protein GCM10010439_50570 [Actinocorallia aurantiaca]|uniref:N-acetyltransferase domain-containing protein n=1 Tax=Actinocorallia aurantiaca TaxID=46204 RepID=A0ABP6GWF4_9ACTN
MVFTIRPTNRSELSVAVSLEEHREAADSAAWSGSGRAWHQQVFEEPTQEHLVGETRGGIVGFAVLSGIGSPGIELNRIVLSHQWRGDGIARMFLRELIARAYGRHAARQVWLNVRSTDEDSLAFYSSEGFVLDGSRPSIRFSPDGSTATLTVMTHQRP